MKILDKVCFSIFLIIVVVVLSTGCQKKIDKILYPFQFNTEKFKTINRKVFLIPTGLFEVVPYAHPYTPKGTTKFCKRIDKSLKIYLLSNNYEVVSSKNIKNIWEHIKNKNGGFFNPITGKISVEKYLKVVKDTIFKLRQEAEFDSIIIPSLEFKSIQMQQPGKGIPYGTAVWDGVKRESLRRRNPWTRHIGVSLQIDIKSDDLNDILLNKGGIDLVTYHKKSYVAGSYKKEKGVITRTKREFIAARNLIEIPQENLMESISIALHPFVMSDYHDTKKTSSYEDDDKRYVNSVGY